MAIYKSRFVQIRELELKLKCDLPPLGGFFDGKFFPNIALNDWVVRRNNRLAKIIQLKYMIKHDYEDLIAYENKNKKV